MEIHLVIYKKPPIMKSFENQRLVTKIELTKMVFVPQHPSWNAATRSFLARIMRKTSVWKIQRDKLILSIKAVPRQALSSSLNDSGQSLKDSESSLANHLQGQESLLSPRFLAFHIKIRPTTTKMSWNIVYPILAKFLAGTPARLQGKQSKLQQSDPAQQIASVA